MQLNVLSAGAAQGVVTALAEPFLRQTGYALECSFGAVGAMQEKLLSGAPADLIILTRALIDGLAADGKVLAKASADLGTVYTGVAVRSSDARPDISGASALRSALLAAGGIYFPDPHKATAGIHFARVLDSLGISAELAPRLRPHPNGATAMRAMAQASGERLIGCTQVTEINNTPGVALVGRLPQEFELGTVYAAGVCAGAASPDAAMRFVELLAGASSRALRTQAGFDIRAA